MTETDVPFAASDKATFTHTYSDDTTAQVVLTAAEQYYEVTHDGTTRYYLFAQGQEISPSTTLHELVHGQGGEHSGHVKKIQLKLRTETISG